MKGAVNSLRLRSIAACAFDGAKKSGIVVACLGDEGPKARFAILEPPRKKAYGREELLAAIADAEGADRVEYADDTDKPYDIYICRSANRPADFVPRDYKQNRYLGSFAEIVCGNVRFSVDGSLPECKPGTACDIAIVPRKPSAEAGPYAEGSLGYAVANAYNAALLGRQFTRETLYLETRTGEHVRVEVRSDSVGNAETLLVTPRIGADGYIEGYATEEFNYFDGGEVSARAYEIKYMNPLHDYFAMSIRKERGTL